MVWADEGRRVMVKMELPDMRVRVRPKRRFEALVKQEDAENGWRRYTVETTKWSI